MLIGADSMNFAATILVGYSTENITLSPPSADVAPKSAGCEQTLVVAMTKFLLIISEPWVRLDDPTSAAWPLTLKRLNFCMAQAGNVLLT
jgi:hypothetical protein